ncbi:UNVERIFIED_CONTAM: Cyclin-dependent kinase inhibitor 3 [Sesamum latifolium]|uniref:Cyclin-dependent kinase inhibitor 3 n=1 Tax=Sesamum latifolium TaxID=2727402 RepID=A0AAW2Y5E9_9LAMI
MGKYTRKAKMTADVALMDVSQSYLGVRTRAKTLALQRLQSAAAAPPPSNPGACYLELRSRRLEKPMQQQNSRGLRQSCGCRGKEDPEVGNREEYFQTGVILGSIEAGVWGLRPPLGKMIWILKQRKGTLAGSGEKVGFLASKREPF